VIEKLKDWFWNLLIAAVLLSWWSLSSAPPAQNKTEETTEKGIPAVVWGSTDAPLDIELESNQTYKVRLWLYQDEPKRSLFADDEPLEGRRTFSVRVPAKTRVELYLDVPRATPGAKLRVVVRQGGKELGRDEAELDRPLKANHVFCGIARFEL
jgi:hypothetical protein